MGHQSAVISSFVNRLDTFVRRALTVPSDPEGKELNEFKYFVPVGTKWQKKRSTSDELGMYTGSSWLKIELLSWHAFCGSRETWL